MIPLLFLIGYVKTRLPHPAVKLARPVADEHRYVWVSSRRAPENRVPDQINVIYRLARGDFVYELVGHYKVPIYACLYGWYV